MKRVIPKTSQKQPKDLQSHNITIAQKPTKALQNISSGPMTQQSKKKTNQAKLKHLQNSWKLGIQTNQASIDTYKQTILVVNALFNRDKKIC